MSFSVCCGSEFSARSAFQFFGLPQLPARKPHGGKMSNSAYFSGRSTQSMDISRDFDMDASLKTCITCYLPCQEVEKDKLTENMKRGHYL